MSEVDETGRAVFVSTHEIPSDTTLASSNEETSSTTQGPAIAVQAEARAVLKKAYRKVDFRLLAYYAVLDLFTRIGEHNIANAAIMNLEQHTDIQHQLGNLNSAQWAFIQSIAEYPALILPPFAALLMRKTSPRIFISTLTICWSVISMCQAASHNFGGLMAMRALLGLLGPSITPAALFHLSCWYSADQLTLRIAIFSAISHLGGILSGLFAYLISKLNGHAGLAGWQYLFILEGALVVLCGILLVLFLPNYPQDVKFLTDEERSAIEGNLPSTRIQCEDKAFSWKQVKDLMEDPITYGFLVIWICHVMGCTGLLTVLPKVIFDLGLSGSNTTQLITIPPAVVGVVSVFSCAYLVRKKKITAWTVAIITESLSCACFIVLLVIEHPVAKYIFITFEAIQAFTLIPILWPERIRTSQGATHAALAIGITSASTALHGIVGPQLFQKKFGPSYRISFGVSVGLTLVAIVAIAITWAIIRRRDKNKQQQGDTVPSSTPMNGLSEEKS